MFRMAIAATALSLTLATGGFAGEQYVDGTGYAVSGYDVVSYFDLPQASVGEAQPAPLKGKADYTAEYNGARFAFASAENRDRFLDDPAAFAPQYDGHCAYGVAKGGKVPGNPNLWRIVDDKLYLNITRNVVGFWEEDIPGNIDLAEQNWDGIEPDAASDRKIPDFTATTPN
ncbi:YHS domain-containing (seleno)protein [Paracoccus sp. Z330]|uniref:YHS domain-containing (Seleno)protein n=1 Tax=Paracoccus onchidii TaxID=3017813 RepID=A0ABT4ZD91_9RHOB|nr:YHS domain-containing (seleno)protein [Paracoccus onchidii]MDB6177324.1 YHS domain-containing (seleno)protein [Paracoccus onchidii]